MEKGNTDRISTMTLTQEYKHLFKQRDFLISLFASFIFLMVSFIINWYAGVYATANASNPVTDIVLSNVRTFDVDGIFVTTVGNAAIKKPTQHWNVAKGRVRILGDMNFAPLPLIHVFAQPLREIVQCIVERLARGIGAGLHRHGQHVITPVGIFLWISHNRGQKERMVARRHLFVEIAAQIVLEHGAA